MRIVTLPGTFRPRSDTWLLARELATALRERAAGHARPPAVVDVGTGSGALATVAALCGAQATAIDRSRRAVATARLTSEVNGVAVRALRGDLLEPVAAERFDLIVSNPPYVPAAEDELPGHGPARATDAGRDGRVLLDRLCAQAPGRLRPGGEILLVHSEVCGEQETLDALRAGGMEADVVARHRGPLGPLLRERRALLVDRGLLTPGQDTEEMLVVRGRVPLAA